jgi:hypothetical protein
LEGSFLEEARAMARLEHPNIAESVTHLHARGLIHRDLEPQKAVCQCSPQSRTARQKNEVETGKEKVGGFEACSAVVEGVSQQHWAPAIG